MDNEPYLVDEKCLELAHHFLQDVPPGHIGEQSQALAETIQKAVEDWFFVRDYCGDVLKAPLSREHPSE